MAGGRGSIGRGKSGMLRTVWCDWRVALVVWRGGGRCMRTWRHDPPGACHPDPLCEAILPQCRHLDNLSKLGAGGAVAIAG